MALTKYILFGAEMKVTKTEWNHMWDTINALQKELAEVRQNTLMPISTGDVLINVIVPRLLDHLGLQAQHGYCGLSAIAPE